jgi:hypothetical protein
LSGGGSPELAIIDRFGIQRRRAIPGTRRCDIQMAGPPSHDPVMTRASSLVRWMAMTRRARSWMPTHAGLRLEPGSRENRCTEPDSADRQRRGNDVVEGRVSSRTWGFKSPLAHHLGNTV